MSTAIAFVQGAEARVLPGVWRGRDVVIKERLVKPYRHPTLDARLRAERTRDEANIIIQARRAGVPVPVVYDVHRSEAAITMEMIPGRVLKDVLPHDDAAAAADRLRALGRWVGALHDAGLTHGDLTTSNVLVRDDDALVLIDFGLGQFSEEDEPRGVDLHLVEEALEATDARAEALMAAFLAGYQPACGERVIKRLDEIRRRGRYREAV